MRARRRKTWLRDITGYLSEFVRFPVSNLPDLGLPANPLLISDSEIEDAAHRTRVYWNLPRGPIANVVLLLENQGVIVARDEFDAESLESMCEPRPNDRPFVMIGTDKGTAVRWRFDAAHELGHLLLHTKIPDGTLPTKDQFKLIENQAHRFAAAFLLPLDEFGDDLFAVTLDAFRAIKPRWKTSIGMMIIRARHAKFLSEDTERSLWTNYNRRKWRKAEPLDDTLEPETPRLLRRGFEMILSEGLQTPDDVVSRLGLSMADIEDLSGCSRGYLSSFSRVQLATDNTESGEASILQFPRNR